MPGNKLNIFSSTPSNGLIILTDTIAHKITIEVADRTGNSSIINFILRYDKSKEKNYDFLRYAKPGMPGIESTMQSANAKAIFSKNAFYDEVAFAMSEMPPTSPMQVSVKIW